MATIRATASAFDAWAEVYDSQPNPLLALEERVLIPLLPEVDGLDIVDAGCGTGRWLKHFAGRAPGHLTGVDVSPVMLAAAGRKLGGAAELKAGSCTALPVPDASADLVLASFVLSYVGDLERFVAEIDRVLRPGGSLLLSDMHPETETVLGWKRSFPQDGNAVPLPSLRHSLSRIFEDFESKGFCLTARAEPQFGEEEREIFAQYGKMHSWTEAQAFPAIYVLRWKKPASGARWRPASSYGRAHRRIYEQGLLTLRGARCASGPQSAEVETLSIAKGCIQGEQHPSTDGVADLDLSGCLLLPGLINAHDHLEFGLFPRLGDGPYRNATEWAHDIQIKHKDTIDRFRRVPQSAAIFWGGLRNLLSGATTVCHHNPIHPDMRASSFPVRVVTNFAWAHSYAFDPELGRKFATSDPHLPFIVHAAEGIDDRSEREIWLLDEMQVLHERTVLVHGLACKREAVALINQRRSAVVLCPTSNDFLFDRRPELAMIRSLRSALLGSDSPLTSAGDLLDEIRYAHQSIGVDPAALYRMVTTEAARVLHLRRGEGTLAPGAVADILVLRDTGLTPAEALVRMTIAQLDVVILGGRVQLASTDFLQRLPAHMVRTLQPIEVDGHLLWVRAPIRTLLQVTREFLGDDVTIGGKRVRYESAA